MNDYAVSPRDVIMRGMALHQVYDVAERIATCHVSVM